MDKTTTPEPHAFCASVQTATSFRFRTLAKKVRGSQFMSTSG